MTLASPIVIAAFIAGCAVVGAWIVLFQRGDRFWRGSERLPLKVPARPVWPAVAVVIPARNEAEGIGQAIGSLLKQNYAGRLRVVLVDDGSDDGTADVARTAAQAAGTADRLEVVRGQPLAPDWSGKLWAVSQGIEIAGRLVPDAVYFLLTDADIVHDAENVARLVTKAEDEKRDLVSLMVKLRCQGFWERWLIPAFVFFFQKLYPFPWVNRDDKKTAGAAGGCMLVRKDALVRIGGVASIRHRLIDDCALGQAIKKTGGGVWLGLTDQVRSLRAYDSLGDIWKMVARTAFEQLGYSWLAVVGATLGMIFLYFGPPAVAVVGFAVGEVRISGMGMLAWLLMATMYGPTLRLYGLVGWRGLFLPLVAGLYAAMTVDSALRHARGRGGAWKGRSYPAR